MSDDAAPALTLVKIILSSVLLALAVYQVALMAVGYQKVRPAFLGAGAASWAHRAIGDAAVAITFFVGGLCLAFYEVEDGIEDHGTRVLIHAVAGSLLLITLAVKVLVVRRGGPLGRFLPVLGLTVLALFAVTWASSALTFLGGPAP